jgi:Fur family ferric uptake transcriptional regulator
MTRVVRYKTRQKEELLSYLKTKPGQHFTARDLMAHLQNQGKNLGASTIYRQLEQLVQEGLVKKYILDGQSAACFEYVGDHDCASQHCFHFKCEKCGQLIHFHCDELEHALAHMLADHGFDTNSLRTVFYGLCENCSKHEDD